MVLKYNKSAIKKQQARIIQDVVERAQIQVRQEQSSVVSSTNAFDDLPDLAVEMPFEMSEVAKAMFSSNSCSH